MGYSSLGGLGMGEKKRKGRGWRKGGKKGERKGREVEQEGGVERLSLLMNSAWRPNNLPSSSTAGFHFH